MRLVIARCQVDYAGKLTAHLPMAPRLLVVKADGSVSVHADDKAYKPLNWMSAPCTLTVRTAPEDLAATTADLDKVVSEVWEVRNASGDTLQIAIAEVLHDSSHDLGVDPGLQKDGVEKHLQALLAENPSALGDGWTLVQREYYTPIGPVDLVCRDAAGGYVAIEVKRRGEIDGVEQLTRYLELMRREPRFSSLSGVLAAQQVKPQARVLAADRGISVVTVDYDALRGLDSSEGRLF
ncbi:MAG TPA: endonuclease NucS [Propionibacteriaceae bacterium]|nr:endonuclease NucS [Propionibacteriaceae bacterium]